MNPMDRSNSGTPIFFIALGLFLGMMLLISGCTTEAPPRSCYSSFEYDLTIRTNEPISNATFYLPLPVKNGAPMIGTLQLDTSQFVQGNFTVDLVQSPPGINLTGTYSVRNNHPWFLKISTSRIDPDPSGTSAYAIEISNFTISRTPVIFADTLYPIGNESVFLPKLDYFQPLREKINPRSPEWIEYAPINVPQKTLVYADYSASPTNRLEIHSGISEHNSWIKPLVPYTVNNPIDGGGNDYSDSYSWTWYGESHGWQVVPGEINGFNSVYPNLDHPRWQKMLNETTGNPS
jgi:hypothetical protein